MSSLEKAENIQPIIRSLVDVSASSLVRVPEIENDSHEDQIRKLQIQIFELSDALAELTEYVKKIPKVASASASRRTFP